MATPGKQVKKVMKRPAKTSFMSPLASSWRLPPQQDMNFILKTLKEKLLAVGLEKKEVKVFRPWRKKKKREEEDPTPDDAAAAAAGSAHQEEQAPPRNGWTDTAARRQLAIGINEVTKALERNELRLVLVCKSVKPQHMTSHLMALSASRGVPACQLPRLSPTASEPLGLTSVLALGFRPGDVFTDAVDAITPRVPALEVAWLPTATVAEAGVTPEKRQEEEEEEEEEMRGQKRKLQSEGEDVTSSSFLLQPLTVKKIVANSAKKRKTKEKTK